MESMLNSSAARVLLVLVLAVGAAACDDEPPTAPTPPAPVTETFSGSVPPNGAQTHSFATAGSGTVTATLKSIAPDPALVIGFSLGNWIPTSSTCQVILANDTATVGAIHSGTMSGIGNLCVRVYDVGNIAANPAAYTVEVVHP
jgi:hypothetical protein